MFLLVLWWCPACMHILPWGSTERGPAAKAKREEGMGNDATEQNGRAQQRMIDQGNKYE